MSEPEQRAEACRWLRFARADLLAAQGSLGRPPLVPRHVCWLAQQAAEKALKALFVFLHVDFPFTHDLDLLRDLLPEGWRVKTACPRLGALTQWAVEARYPSDWAEPTEADARSAVQEAEAVWEAEVRSFCRSCAALADVSRPRREPGKHSSYQFSILVCLARALVAGLAWVRSPPRLGTFAETR